jgi:hypothetical protein
MNNFKQITGLKRNTIDKYYCSYCNYGTFSIDLFNKHKNFIIQIKK